MKHLGRRILRVSLLCLCLSAWVQAGIGYVQITRNRANIRSAPTTSSALVVTVRKGDVFELVGEEGRWYRIRLFSGDYRYVHKTLAGPISYRVEVPGEVSARRQLFEAFEDVDERVRIEAEARSPARKDLAENIRRKRLLEDRYRMEVVWKFQTAAPVFRSIMIEGSRKGW